MTSTIDLSATDSCTIDPLITVTSATDPCTIVTDPCTSVPSPSATDPCTIDPPATDPPAIDSASITSDPSCMTIDPNPPSFPTTPTCPINMHNPPSMHTDSNKSKSSTLEKILLLPASTTPTVTSVTPSRAKKYKTRNNSCNSILFTPPRTRQNKCKPKQNSRSAKKTKVN